MANKFILKTNDSARAGYLKRSFSVGDATGKVRLEYFIKVSEIGQKHRLFNQEELL